MEKSSLGDFGKHDYCLNWPLLNDVNELALQGLSSLLLCFCFSSISNIHDNNSVQILTLFRSILEKGAITLLLAGCLLLTVLGGDSLYIASENNGFLFHICFSVY